MATYKVIQDIEAEDKFLGPLTLKQFIYAAIVVLCAYASFFAITKGTWLVAAILSPVMLFGGFLAWPWSQDQPTEIWLLAKIRFFLKPRRRIWDQNGMKHLVTITAPKYVDPHLTNGLSQTEVRSRLQALANTIDSRGWAIKNVNLNLFSEPSYVLGQAGSDRLIDPSSLAQDVPGSDVTAVDDVLDERSNPTAQHFDAMIQASTRTHRQQAVSHMQQVASGQPDTSSTASQTTQSDDNWFIDPAQPPLGASMFGNSSPYQTITAITQDQTALKTTHNQAVRSDLTDSHNSPAHPTVGLQAKHNKKNHDSKAAKKDTKQAQATSTVTPDPGILELANNDDLNVATIARQANQARNQPSQDEVVISLR